MNHWFLSLLEYGLLPFFLVCATICIKYLAKSSRRIKWKLFLTIGMDLIMMCTFGLLILGISVMNHFNDDETSLKMFFYCICFSFFFFIISVILTLLIRHWGEKSQTSFWVQNTVGIVCIVTLMIFISNSNQLFELNPKRNSVQIEIPIKINPLHQ